MSTEKPASTRALIAWSFYDWANSAFPTTVISFVFAAYFAKAVAPTEELGQVWWSWGVGVSALVVAIIAPVLGAIADKDGRRKPWIAAFTLLCIAATAGLWFIRPEAELAIMALVLVGLANVGFEMSSVFYNAMLPSLAPADRLGRWSGWAWGIGYAGGLAMLAICLFGFVQAETPLFGVGKEDAANVRVTSVAVAVWFAVFSLPMFLMTPDSPGQGRPMTESVREGLTQLAATFSRVRDYRDIAVFLLARVLYIDGLTTLFVVGAIFAGTVFGLTFEEIILFGIAINVFSGVGAALFGWVDDLIGPKPTILISIAGLVLLVVGLLMVESKTLFWIFGLPLGLFVGPIQAASRTMMAQLAPPELRGEMFGLFAFSGKATAFVGPILLGSVTAITGSQRIGMGVIVAMLIGGGLLLAAVRMPARK